MKTPAGWGVRRCDGADRRRAGRRRTQRHPGTHGQVARHSGGGCDESCPMMMMMIMIMIMIIIMIILMMMMMKSSLPLHPQALLTDGRGRGHPTTHYGGGRGGACPFLPLYPPPRLPPSSSFSTSSSSFSTSPSSSSSPSPRT